MIDFRIDELREVSNDSKLRASFSVAIPGVGEIRALLFDGKKGPFVKPLATRDATGTYRENASFDRGFAHAVTEAVVAELEHRRALFDAASPSPRTSGVETPRAAPPTSALARGARTARKTRAASQDHAAAFLALQEQRFERADRELDDI